MCNRETHTYVVQKPRIATDRLQFIDIKSRIKLSYVHKITDITKCKPDIYTCI